MSLITENIKIPSSYSTKELEDAILQAKLIEPGSNNCWYIIEYDEKEELFYGLINNILGYFSLKELESFGIIFGLHVELDWSFEPSKLSTIPRCSQYQ